MYYAYYKLPGDGSDYNTYELLLYKDNNRFPEELGMLRLPNTVDMYDFVSKLNGEYIGKE